MEHYSCIVDMLARAGHLNGGIEVIKRMSEEGLEASVAAWGALLGASRRFGDHEIGRNIASHVLELEPSSSAGFVLSSNMYAEAGLRDEAAKFRLWMREKGVRIVSGSSLVHVGQHAMRFVSWDESDSRTEEIYSMTKLLHSFMQRHDENDLFHDMVSHF
ncbi:Pentatricopeptide repeat-containing protein [Platanthera guangdongensis]|uniref:Pentatricopeptide repeat-containing protein n=1 Tax=Platanthera guangdongensis TaxID=2320717 RepID=A0ABR2N1P6_9ASPA